MAAFLAVAGLGVISEYDDLIALFGAEMFGDNLRARQNGGSHFYTLAIGIEQNIIEYNRFPRCGGIKFFDFEFFTGYGDVLLSAGSNDRKCHNPPSLLYTFRLVNESRFNSDALSRDVKHVFVYLSELFVGGVVMVDGCA